MAHADPGLSYAEHEHGMAAAALVEIGISEDLRRDIAGGVSRLLADTYTLYLKTQNFHWNVTGPSFPQLHALFEQHYQALAAATDDLAERIRALGFAAPASFRRFTELSVVEDETGVPAAEEMVRQLLRDHEAVIRTARSIVPVVEDAHDQVTLDLVTKRLAFHEKTAWMLRSYLVA